MKSAAFQLESYTKCHAVVATHRILSNTHQFGDQMFKWLLIVVVTIFVLFVGYRFYSIGDTNDRVANEIRSNPTGALAQRTMLVTLIDKQTYPVNYLREGGLVFMGIDGLWWRNFRGEGQQVDMFIQGELLSGHATVVLDNPEYVDDIFSRLRPTVPSWLPRWLNGKLVVIKPKS